MLLAEKDDDFFFPLTEKSDEADNGIYVNLL